MRIQTLTIAAFILFGIYRRVSRSVGWKQISEDKMGFRIVISAVVRLIFLVEGALHRISLISDLGGVV